ncbi:MAG: hypothetical protein WDW36_002311 [Sanguina aurantia]
MKASGSATARATVHHRATQGVVAMNQTVRTPATGLIKSTRSSCAHLKQTRVAPATSRARTVTLAAAPGASSFSMQKKTVVITGASSGLGLQAAKALALSGEWHVVMACRDFLKAEKAAKAAGIPVSARTIMHLDLSSLDSVRQFVDNFNSGGRPLDVLVANAALYLPTAKEPTYTADGYEISVATNHLGHFLLCNLLLDNLKASSSKGKRMIIVGSITGQTNTLAGTIPPQADLGELQGLQNGFKEPISMIDGGKFDGAKAYKDSKVCNMLTMREFHRRYHDSTGVTFSSLYPGCIAETGLFRNHVKPFQVLFPVFQKYVTKGYVSESEAGKRLAKVVSDPLYNVSSAYWSWKEGSEGFVNEVSDEVSNWVKGERLWEVSEQLVGLAPSESKGATAKGASATSA